MIKLSNDQIDILGRPNFACARIAKVLIAAGVYEDKAKKAEYEQAVFIHWAMGLFDKHGEKWHEAGDQILSECAEKIKAKAASNPPVMSRDQALAWLVENVKIWPKSHEEAAKYKCDGWAFDILPVKGNSFGFINISHEYLWIVDSNWQAAQLVK